METGDKFLGGFAENPKFSRVFAADAQRFCPSEAIHTTGVAGCVVIREITNRFSEPPLLVTALAITPPIELMAAQVDCETLTLPTGAKLFSRGAPADSIYAVRRGIVEVVGEGGEKLCYRPGEFLSYQDIVWFVGSYRNEAFARTPVEVLRLERLRFLNLLHNHPTLAVLLISQQHERLREQRTSGTCCY